MRSANKLLLTVESRSVNEGLCRIACAALAAQADPTVEAVADVKTAVSEAVTNAIVHAYPESIGLIYIAAQLYEDGRLVVRIRDRGRGIENVAQAMEPLFTTDPGGERSGLGFTVMESLCDSVRVRSSPGKGTVVTLQKRLLTRAKGE